MKLKNTHTTGRNDGHSMMTDVSNWLKFKEKTSSPFGYTELLLSLETDEFYEFHGFLPHTE